MATLAENAAAVKAAQEAIDAAIVAKGGTTDGGLTNAAEAIGNLPNPMEKEYVWEKPDICPFDIKSIVESDPEDFAYKMGVVLLPSTGFTLTDGLHHRTSDGVVFDGNGTVTFANPLDWHWIMFYSNSPEFSPVGLDKPFWIYGTKGSVLTSSTRANPFICCADIDVRASEPFNTAYAIKYVRKIYSLGCYDYGNGAMPLRVGEIDYSLSSSSTLLSNSVPTRNCRTFVSNYRGAAGRELFIDDIGLVDMNFSGCSPVELRASSFPRDEVPNIDTSNLTTLRLSGSKFYSIPESFDTSKCVSLANAFEDCNNLIDASHVKFDSCTNVAFCLANCHSLIFPPEVIDFGDRNVEGVAHMFIYSDKCVRLPIRLTTNYSFSFSDFTSVIDKSSVAEFDDSGSIVGGMIGNLNVCTNASPGQTITLNNHIKSLFSSEEQDEIERVMLAKNWVLAW